MIYNLTSNNGIEFQVSLDKTDVVSHLEAYKKEILADVSTGNCAMTKTYHIPEDVFDYASAAEIEKELDRMIHGVQTITQDELVECADEIKKKKNGKFRKGSIHRIDYLDYGIYDCDLINSWHTMTLNIYALDENTLEVSVRNEYLSD